MEFLLDPSTWIALITLIILEVVLGIDNLVFIAILANKLPPHQRDRARITGLSLAVVMRLGLLSGVSWLVTLTAPLFTVFRFEFSGRDLILLAGGFFLLFKATTELHERLEGQHAWAGREPRVRWLLAGGLADHRARCGVLPRCCDHGGGHGRQSRHHDDRRGHLGEPDADRVQAIDAIRRRPPPR